MEEWDHFFKSAIHLVTQNAVTKALLKQILCNNTEKTRRPQVNIFNGGG